MKYRKEIDGLRALAVVPVILFHAGFTTFSGGFVGVDIFFVISGYLITTIIAAEMEQGSFSLVKFYERRARRILPALLFVMLCALPFAWFWMVPQEFKSFSESLVAVPLFTSNILFYLTSGYFDTASELKPLLHTWSLAVEEQFYILFPLFLMLIWRLSKKWIISLLLLVTIASLLTAQWGSTTHPLFTFYSLPTRSFEILIGALISFYINHKQKYNLSQPVNQSISLVGLAFILFSIFAFDKSTPSPSIHSLIPTIGAILILICSNNKNLVGKLLGSKLFAGVGLISYSAYLWHQPLFAFARLRCIDEPSILLLGLLAILSLILGYLSWKFIETPFRSKNLISRKNIFFYGTICSVFFITTGFYGYLTNGIPKRFPQEIRNFIEPINFKWDENVRADICHLQDINLSTHKQVCFENKRPLIALWGDSHAASLYPGLKNLQNKKDIFGILQMTEAGCGPIFNLETLIYRKNCNAINSNNLEVLKKIQPQMLILNAAWKHWDYPLNDSELEDKFNTTIKIIKNSLPGTRIIVIGPPPKWKKSPQYDAYDVLREKNLSEFPLRINAEKLITTEKILRRITLQNQIEYISITDIFCNQIGCLTRVNKNELDFVQSDNWHLSIYGSELLSNQIASTIFMNGQNSK